MMILTFNRAQYFHQNLTDNDQLCAFALGSELPSVYTLIGNKQEMALSSLNEQRRLEAIAKQCYERFMEDPTLQLVLDKYADSMMTSGMVMFHDVRLHAQSPGLTLAKYYCALKQTDGHLDRSMVWEKHLQWCQALSFALYEHCQDPRSDICYGEKTVIIDKPHNRQCFSSTDISTGKCLGSGKTSAPDNTGIPITWVSRIFHSSLNSESASFTLSHNVTCFSLEMIIHHLLIRWPN